LGVRASQQQQNVSIVVNNNTQETATAQESIDSRGNRRIEVTVGDMVSQQITKPGSNLRETMRSNYNLRPAMIRR
jgi:hypothetical protein